MVARTGSSPEPKLPVCGWTHDGSSCRKRGDHHCKQRADHVIAFFTEVLVHTKGRYARTPFIPAPWQDKDILRPLFGEVIWSEEQEAYVRRFVVAWIELGRKNGKALSVDTPILDRKSVV